jgi:hypothetical protein
MVDNSWTPAVSNAWRACKSPGKRCSKSSWITSMFSNFSPEGRSFANNERAFCIPKKRQKAFIEDSQSTILKVGKGNFITEPSSSTIKGVKMFTIIDY